MCSSDLQGSQRKTGCQFTFTCDGSLARESSADLNPAKLQLAYDEGLRQAQQQHTASGDVLAPVRTAPAPTYTQELQQRGGDTLYRGEKLPDSSGIKAEYRNSGKWIGKPGT